jgi:protein TonB
VLADAPRASELSDDPLDQPRTSRVELAVLLPLLVFAAVGAHVVFTGIVWAAGAIFGTDRKHVDDEPVMVTVVEEPPPPPPEPERPPEPPPPEPEPAKPKPKPAAKLPPPPDPSPPKPPPKLVGIDVGSTVAGGSGPSFGTGDSLAGETAATQQDKPETKPTTEQPASETKTNRTATRIPQKGVEVVKPKRLGVVKPNYPAKLRAQGIEADVVVEVRLDPSGTVLSASIVVPSDYPEMNDEALAAARREKFSPATRDGSPIDFTLTYTVRFRLSDS